MQHWMAQKRDELLEAQIDTELMALQDSEVHKWWSTAMATNCQEEAVMALLSSSVIVVDSAFLWQVNPWDHKELPKVNCWCLVLWRLMMLLLLMMEKQNSHLLLISWRIHKNGNESGALQKEAEQRKGLPYVWGMLRIRIKYQDVPSNHLCRKCMQWVCNCCCITKQTLRWSDGVKRTLQVKVMKAKPLLLAGGVGDFILNCNEPM